MILEGIVTSLNEDGSTNVAPMGPVFDELNCERFTLRPFQTSLTFANLNRIREGVLHIADNVSLFVDGALNSFDENPKLQPASKVNGHVIEDCCRYHEFRVTSVDQSNPRTELECHVIYSRDVRPFWGFNRAKHAVLELTILATRIHLLDKEEIVRQHSTLRSAVIKTGGKAELTAFEKLESFLISKKIALHIEGQDS